MENRFIVGEVSRS